MAISPGLKVSSAVLFHFTSDDGNGRRGSELLGSDDSNEHNQEQDRLMKDKKLFLYSSFSLYVEK